MYNYGRGLGARFAVSAMVVTRDRNRDCTQAVESLLKQTAPPAEIIVVDSASMTPFTYAHPKVKVIRTDSDMGLSYVTGCSENGVIIGCNMAVRKEIVQKAGYFNPSLGRKKGRLLSAEEFEFLDRARQNGMQTRFTELMKVHHKITLSRLTFRYLFNRLIWEGISRYIILRERKTQLNILATVWAGIISDCLRILTFQGRRLSAFALAIRFGELYGLIYGARLLRR